MSGFIEVRVKGDARAFIEAGSIAGIVTSPDCRIDVVATPDSPLAVILRGGATLEVYGECARDVMLRAALIRKHIKSERKEFSCDFVENSLLDNEEALRELCFPTG